jgi:hypothetical protein
MSGALYELYQATGPDGRAYIGATRRGVDVRWREQGSGYGAFDPDAHEGGAAFGCVVQWFGRDGFAVEHIASARGPGNAAALERQLIAERGTLWPTGFNRSAGGTGLNRGAA